MANEKLNSQHVFIVGLPRTGTKLVKVIMNKSDDVCFRICDETWFLGDLFRAGIRRKIREIGDMREDKNVALLVQYLFSGKFKRSYWLLVNRPGSRFDQAEFLEELLKSDRSDKEIYNVFMQIFAARDPIWESAHRKAIGDKTPGHLYYVPLLLEWYPEAKIVHTFRDPRAIVASELKKIVDGEDESDRSRIRSAYLTALVVMYITVTWLYARRLHHKYASAYPQNYYLSKYEDLVGDPQVHVRKLCDFLSISVDSAMLAPRQADSSFSDSKKREGFNAANVNRWREYLRPWIRNWFVFWTGRHLDEFGYRR